MVERPQIEPGVYFGLPESVYHAAPGLSNSGMKQLAVSPLNYWHCNLNPDYERPQETDAQRFGTAVHCRLLEPERFPRCYAEKLSRDDYPNALDTIDEMKAFLLAHNLPTSCKRKQELIDRIREHELDVEIWDDVQTWHAEATAGKVLLGRKEWQRVDRVAEIVAADPFASAAVTGGVPEVSFFVRDPETGVLLKARMDYVRPTATIDVKTFSNSRGKPTDKAVFEAIYYEGYYRQCVFYHRVRELARQQLVAGEIGLHGEAPPEWLQAFLAADQHNFAFLFIESTEPFDLRVVVLRRAEAPGADTNIFWASAEMQIAEMTAIYAECVEKYGDGPWREPHRPHVLADTDLPQLLFT